MTLCSSLSNGEAVQLTGNEIDFYVFLSMVESTVQSSFDILADDTFGHP